MSEVATALLATALLAIGQSNPGQIDAANDTALILACTHNMPEIALILIAMDVDNIDHVNHGDTALTWACSYGYSEVALALIATGRSNPGNVNDNGDTALIWACRNNMNNIALALIATGMSNLFHANNNMSVYFYARKNKMHDVVNELKKRVQCLRVES